MNEFNNNDFKNETDCIEEEQIFTEENDENF